MKRPKFKPPHQPQHPQSLHPDVSPWITPPTTNENDNLEQIPTYRREIVQKFMNNIHTKARTNTYHDYSGSESVSKQKQKSRSIDKQEQQKKVPLRNKIYSKTEQIHNQDKDKDNAKDHKCQECEAIKIFRQQYNKRKKSKIKTTIINFNPQSLTLSSTTIAQDKKQKIIRQQEQNKKTFTRKLRLKQEIANKKNIMRASKKLRSATVTNIFSNPYFLYEFGNIEGNGGGSKRNSSSMLGAHGQNQNPAVIGRVYSGLKRRPASEAGHRPSSNYNLY